VLAGGKHNMLRNTRGTPILGSPGGRPGRSSRPSWTVLGTWRGQTGPIPRRSFGRAGRGWREEEDEEEEEEGRGKGAEQSRKMSTRRRRTLPVRRGGKNKTRPNKKLLSHSVIGSGLALDSGAAIGATPKTTCSHLMQSLCGSLVRHYPAGLMWVGCGGSSRSGRSSA